MPAPNKRVVLWPTVLEMAQSGSTQSEIAQVVGVNSVTIAKWAREEGFAWPQKSGGRPRAERIETSCQKCGKEMLLTNSLAASRRFCSRSCTNAWQRDQAQGSRVTMTCICGAQFEVDPSDAGRGRRFCSKPCATLGQGRRQPDPANHRTQDCQTCDKPFTRYKNYGNGHLKFCSNECAAKHTKVKKHYVLRDSDVVLDSSWEGLVYCLLVYLKIPVERVDRGTAVEYAEGHWYAPDFQVGDLGIEVKGLEDDEDLAKWDTWRSERGPLKVVDQAVMNRIRRCVSAEEAMRVLSSPA